MHFVHGIRPSTPNNARGDSADIIVETDDITKFSAVAGFDYEESENIHPPDVKYYDGPREEDVRQIEDLERTNGELLIRISELEADLQCRNRELYDCRDHINSLTSDLTAQKENVSAQVIQIKEFVAENEALKSELLSIQHSHEDGTNALQENMESEFSSFRETIDSLQEEISNLTADLFKCRNTLSEETSRRKISETSCRNLQESLLSVDSSKGMMNMETKIDLMSEVISNALNESMTMFREEINEKLGALNTIQLITQQTSHSLDNIESVVSVLPNKVIPILDKLSSSSLAEIPSAKIPTNNQTADPARTRVLQGLRAIAENLKPLDSKFLNKDTTLDSKFLNKDTRRKNKSGYSDEID